MKIKGILSYSFNMSLGFTPVIITILLCGFISQELATFVGTAVGIVSVYFLWSRKGTYVPNYILYISTLLLSLISLVYFLPSNFIPPKHLPFTLEVSMLIPMLILFMHKNSFINHFIEQTKRCNKHLYAQGAEAAIVSSRIVLILGIIHFLIISIFIIVQTPLSLTSRFILFQVIPPIVFILSILFNQYAIMYFNHLMSHVEYVPIVNTKGDVIGKSLAVEALNYKNSYINPVIRIAVYSHGKLLLSDRPMNAIFDKGKVDLPMECYLRYGESLREGVNRVVKNTFSKRHTSIIKPEFNIFYHFENHRTNRLIYLYIANIDDDSVLESPHLKNRKLWNFKQIEENLNKNFFSSCFENEYEHLKEVICTKEKYMGS